MMKKRKPETDSEDTDTTEEDEVGHMPIIAARSKNELLPNAVAIRPSIRMRSKIRESIRQSKIRPAKFEVQEAVAKLMMKNSQEQRQIRKISKMMKARQSVVAVLAISSIILGVIVNELCVAGEYIDHPLTPEEQAAMNDPNRPARKCTYSIAEYVKLLQSFVTAVMLGLIIVQFRLHGQLQCSQEKLVTKSPLDGGKEDPPSSRSKMTTSWKDKVRLYFELVVNSIHTVPFVYYDFPLQMSGSTFYYRLESILCAVMLLRLYHVWRWVHMKVQFRYFNPEESYLLRDHATVKMFQNSNISFRLLSIKVAIKRHPVEIISALTLSIIVTITYFIRIAEGPAYQKHSTYIWDQMWIVYVTLTTVGYGNIVPVTHFGRFAACIAMAVGPIIVAFITASITQTLQMSEDEAFIMQKMDHNHLRFKVLNTASKIIQLWWRRKAIVSRTRSSSIRMSIFKNLHRRASEYEIDSKGSEAFEAKKEELYRQLYFAIEELRRFTKASIPLSVQYEDVNSDKNDVRQSRARSPVAAAPQPSSNSLQPSISKLRLPKRGDVGRNHFDKLESSQDGHGDGADGAYFEKLEKNVEQIKRVLDSVENRLTALEKTKPKSM